MSRFFLLLFFSGVAAADHLPIALIARGKAETVLCGIDVYHATLASLQERFGKAKSFDKYPKTEEAAEIEWDKNGTVVHVTINVNNIAYAVELSGKPATMARTGSGLALGETLSDLKRIYGSRFLQRGGTITLQWKDGTELRVRVANGKIVSLLLIAEVE